MFCVIFLKNNEKHIVIKLKTVMEFMFCAIGIGGGWRRVVGLVIGSADQVLAHLRPVW